jgi:uncharacterized membrane protein
MSESTRTGGGGTDSPEPPRAAAEPRWPMATAVLAATILYVGMPHSGAVTGWWVFPVLQLVLLGCLVVEDPGRIDRRSVTLKWLMTALLVVMTLGTMVAVIVLAYEILVAAPGISATALLGRGAAVWFANVIIFSLWYWQIDRGGPAERAAGSSIPASFAFPENATPELVPPGWRPEYPDYLYLAYTNATAFSPTDTLPVRRWAKLTMMIQSTMSLVIAILVIARAINVLPG